MDGVEGGYGVFLVFELVFNFVGFLVFMMVMGYMQQGCDVVR